MKAIDRRLRALEGEREYYSLGEVLDRVIDRQPLEPGRVNPRLIAALEGLGR